MPKGLVLVTGGAGFIGSHVVERLLSEGYRVRVLDNLSTGKRENLAPHFGQIEFIDGDIRTMHVVESAMAGVSAVIHLAAVASVPKSVQDPFGTHETNYVGTMHVVEAMRRRDVRRILYASSAAVYSPFKDEPHSETDLPDPSTPYGLDKLAGEHCLNIWGRLYGISPTAFRFFNIYGERQDPTSAYSGVISIFVDRLRSDRGITIFGDGQQSRDFVYVGDLAKLLVAMLPVEDAPHVINVGTGASVSLLGLVAALETVLGRRAEVNFAPARAGDIPRSQADNGRVTAQGFDTWTSLQDGLTQLCKSHG